MQLQLSGVLASRPSQQGELNDDASTETIDVAWVCRICGKPNKAGDGGDGCDPERCRCCRRDRDPLWLWLEKYELQVHIGTQLRLTDDAAFGTRIGVVCGIDIFMRRTQVLAILTRAAAQSTAQDVAAQRGVKSASGRRSRFRFEMIEYDTSQLQRLTPTSAETTDQVQELIAALEHHGLCGDCRRVFRIAQGDVGQHNANREAIRSLQDELQQLCGLKSQNIKLREYDRVLENTAKIQSMNRQLMHQKRKVEFLSSLSCPHCGWTAEREKQSIRG